MVIAAVAILGTFGFTYYGRLDVRKAELTNTSLRTAELLLNDWKATGGSAAYDPIQSFSNQFTISQSFVGPEGLESLLGRYDVLIDGNTYRVTLSYRDAADDMPKVLNVVVAWLEDSGVLDATDSRRFVKLSAYVGGHQ